MDAEKDQTQHNKEPDTAASKAGVSTNPELGIKRVRTFADDLREAKEKAGIKDTPEQKRSRSGFFGRKKPKVDKIAEEKTLSKHVQPGVAPDEASSEEREQPSREYIEQELARSGIIAPRSEQGEEKTKEEKSSIPAIRTYKYDAAESVQNKNLSQVKIAAAEQMRRAKNKDFSSYDASGNSLKRNLIYIALSVVLIVTGLWGGIHFYRQSKIVADPAVTPNEGVLLFTNSETELQINDAADAALIGMLEGERSKPFTDGTSIKEVVLTEDTFFGKRTVTGNSFLDRLSNVPGPLSRAVSSDFLFGIHGGTDPAPLLVFKTDDFDTTFAGMLDWEATMSSDLAPLFGTPTRGEFEDVILRNKDTRVLKDQFGTIRLIYGFPNTETLVITTNENTFFEVFDRLIASNATRN